MSQVAWHQRIGPWLGVATGPGAYILGGELASRFPTWSFVLIVGLGGLLLTLLLALNGVVHRRRRQRFVLYAAHVFGTQSGKWLLNGLMLLSLLGWFSFHIGISGFSLATLLKGPGWLGALLIGCFMLLLNFIGIRRWNALVWVTSGAALSSVFVALAVVPFTPVSAPSLASPLTLVWGVGSVIAFSIVFAVRCGDFTWDLADDREVLKTALAFYLILSFALSIGALLYRRTGGSNLAELLAQSPAAWLGHVFLILAAVSPSISNIFSGSLNLEALMKLPPWLSALLITIVGVILGATRFDLRLLPFLGWVGTVLPPLVVVMIGIYTLKIRPLASQTLLAWLLGAAVAVLLRIIDSQIYVIAGLVVSSSWILMLYRVGIMELAEASETDR